MAKRFELVKEILWRPLWVWITAGWTIASNLPGVISSVGYVTHQDVKQYSNVLIESNVFAFLSAYWLPILIIAYLAAIAEGLFKKTRPYLGEEIRARVRTEEYPQNARPEPHLSLKVFNDESTDLTQCYVRLLELKHFYNPHTILDIAEEANPNNLGMTWGGGSPTQYTTIERNGNNAVLNICKSTGAGLVFLFHGHEHRYVGQGKFRVRVELNGLLGNKTIKPIVCRFCFEYGPVVGMERRPELQARAHQVLRVQVSSSKSMFAFVDCPKKED